MLEFLRQQLGKLLEERAALKTQLDGVLAGPAAEKRDHLTDAEQATFTETRDAIRAKDGDIEAMQVRIAELEEVEKRGQTVAELAAKYGGEQRAPGQRGVGGGVVTYEPMTYRKTGDHSYFQDLARVQFGNDTEARDRLLRHAKELDVELPARERRREEAARREVRTIDGVSERAHESVFERRVNPNRTDGQGGYFVPPLWLVDEYIDLPRFGRVVANSVRNLTLPAGTDSVNLPKILTGTRTGVQTADAAAVTSQDLTDDFVSAPVRTIAGQQDVAMQLIDQSPITFDEVLFADLIADYNQQTDVQVISGTGANGQVTGILNTSGINAVTYTDADPTLPEMYVPLVQSASRVATARKMPATAVFLLPSLWYWATSELDTSKRPLITVENGQPFNPAALQTGEASEGPVGRFAYGLPALMDGNIPSNLGAGTNETRVLTMRTSDLYLWEGAMRTRVLMEVLSGTLQVRFQVYGYVAFMANRRPSSISVMSGTGVIPAAGF